MSRKQAVQVFCQCGKGRAFIVTQSRQSVKEWYAQLRAQGWQVEDGKTLADKCNNCNEPQKKHRTRPWWGSLNR